jgi:hypothetical protein
MFGPKTGVLEGGGGRVFVSVGGNGIIHFTATPATLTPRIFKNSLRVNPISLSKCIISYSQSQEMLGLLTKLAFGI